jgi:hypothetical protein
MSAFISDQTYIHSPFHCIHSLIIPQSPQSLSISHRLILRVLHLFGSLGGFFERELDGYNLALNLNCTGAGIPDAC